MNARLHGLQWIQTVVTVVFALPLFPVSSFANTSRPWGGPSPYSSTTAQTDLTEPGKMCDFPPIPGKANDWSYPIDPVLLTGGKFFLPVTDVEIPGPGRMNGLNIRFRRSYSNQDAYSGAFSAGWTSTLDFNIQAGLSFTEFMGQRLLMVGSWFVIHDEDGSYHTFVAPTNIVADPGQAVVLRDGIYTLVYSPGADGISATIHLKKPYGTVLAFSIEPSGLSRIDYIQDRRGNRLSFGLDDQRRVNRITDDAGHAISVTYNAIGRVASLTDPLGRIWNYAYNAGGGQLERVTDPMGRVTQYAYEDVDPNNITRVTDPSGSAMLFTYDAEDRVTWRGRSGGPSLSLAFNPLLGSGRMVDENGKTWDFQYANIGLTTITIDPSDRIQMYGYDSNNDMNAVWDLYGKYRTFQHDADQNLTQIRDSFGNVTNFTYENRMLKTQTDALGRTTTYNYDTDGDLVSITDPLGRVQSFAHDAHGLVTQVTNRKGRVTQFVLDAAGNTTRVTDALNGVTQFVYDAAGRLTRVTDALGRATQYAYDAGDRLTRVTFPDTTQLNFTYDTLDRLLTSTNALGQVTRFEYGQTFDESSCRSGGCGASAHDSGLSKPTAITDPAGNVTRMTYNSRGKLLTLTDPMGRITRFEYDGADKLTATVDPSGARTARAYSYTGNLVSLTDAANRTTNWTYDVEGRVTRMTYPDGSTENYTYDALWNTASFTDRSGQALSYAYDAAGRLTGVTGAGVSLALAYDAEDNVLTATEPGVGTFTHTYDNLERLTQVSQPGSLTVGYTYNALGLRTRMTYPGGSTLDYVYNNMNRLTTLRRTSSLSYGFTYDAAGRRTQLTYPNGVRVNYAYDAAGRLTSEAVTGVGWSETIAQTYDLSGNVLSRTDGAGARTYGYDATAQLTAAGMPAGYTWPSTAYVYDSVGNRTVVFNGGNPISYVSNLINQYTQVGSAVPTYDTRGNLTYDGLYTYVYDARNRLAQAKQGSTVLTTQLYDWANRLNKKTVGSAVTQFGYDGAETIQSVAGSTTTRWFYGPGLDEVLADQVGSTYRYLIRDPLNSTVILTNSSGAIIERYAYDAFGNTQVQNASRVNQTTAPKTPWLFTGRYYHPEAKVYDFRNRAYLPKFGRFMQVDPVGFRGADTNLYRYVTNSPGTFTDPIGLWKWYGNWGGPGWTNGTDKWTEDDDFPREGEPGFVLPIDERDWGYYRHDTCLRDCGMLPCERARKICRRGCDWNLAKHLRRLKGKCGDTFAEEMTFGAPKSPNDNPGSYIP